MLKLGRDEYVLMFSGGGRGRGEQGETHREVHGKGKLEHRPPRCRSRHGRRPHFHLLRPGRHLL